VSNPVLVQRMEGLAILVLAVAWFASTGETWWWFAGLLLVPDLSMAGYMVDPRVGAIAYNTGHTLLVPAFLGMWYWLGGADFLAVVAAVWLAHIGMDRLFGYGLKHADDFGHTHLGRIGRGSL
jgi:hypothetical protein